ncbi:hypothetical protein FGL97_09000 [Pseudomonas putida]|uniref:hypothetical protein n=1 Tax=Pseudomonas putida TaxID=303 RepID=UPI00159E85FD|nr:hypothetical protein [Pseudomonas putida]NVN63360.1 hypothetical protein [Pseudomonas putida]NVN68353.1 hypothetical protein [Pseudomonas putida]
MSQSVSGTAVPSKPALFPVELRGRAGQQVEKQLDAARRTRQRENERKLKDARAEARHEVEMLAVEYARAMLERDLHAAIELEKTHPELAFKLRGRIMDRAIGKVPQVDEEAAAKRKGSTAGDMIDFLRAVTMVNNQHAGIAHTPVAPAPGERDVTPIEHNGGGEWFEYPTNTEGEDDE